MLKLFPGVASFYVFTVITMNDIYFHIVLLVICWTRNVNDAQVKDLRELRKHLIKLEENDLQQYLPGFERYLLHYLI